MNNEERKIKISELNKNITKLQREMNDLKHNCPHNIVKKHIAEDCDVVRCDICNKSFGWWCPKSKDGICVYTDSEFCDCCGNPSERK